MNPDVLLSSFICIYFDCRWHLLLFMVLLAAFDERRYEISLMRALGANHHP